MAPDHGLAEKAAQLDQLTMRYETAVIRLPAQGYLEAFREHYEIRHVNAALIPSPDSFRETLKEVSGDDVWQPIAAETEKLFGVPKRVMILEDGRPVTDALEGPDGLGPFFFIFDLMFCEYDGFTLCFISGSNN